MFADQTTIPLIALYRSSVDPAVTFTDGRITPGIQWIDESTGAIGTWKKRNEDNDGWDTLLNLDATATSDTPQTLTDGATVTWATGGVKYPNATVTLGGNRTLAITGAVSGQSGTLVVKQDATGSRTLTLPAGSKVRDGGSGAITLSTAANSIDVLSYYYDGTNYFWTYAKNYT